MLDDIDQLLKRKEDLNPELEAYLKTLPGGLQIIQHPYVQELGYIPQLNAMLNHRLRKISEAVEEALVEKKYDDYMFWITKPFKLHKFLEIQFLLSDKQYWSLLRDIYVMSEGIYVNRYEWIDLFVSKRPWKSKLMTPHERKKLKALPNELTVYRGIQSEDDDGFSYTLDKKRAEFFANRHHREGEFKEVISMKIPKSDVLAYFNCRKEQEVIVI